MKNLIPLLILFLSLSNPAKNMIEIPSIFSDNMVLQQNSIVSFWGKADSELDVTINSGWGESAKTSVNPDNSWMVKIKTPVAGGPFEINLQIGDSVITFKNVLIGEVWFCSGQSNMEMPLEGWPPTDTILNSDVEIKNADFPEIRFFTVQKSFSHKEEFNCQGNWEECNPNTAAKFSAAAFFFGRKLYKELNIPIGLINSSWGGTSVEPWTSGKYLESTDQFKNVINAIKMSGDEFLKYNAWLTSHPIIDTRNKPAETKWTELDFDDVECNKRDYNDDNWKEMNLPTLWEATEVGNFDGAVWFRKKIKLPLNWKNQDLVLELGPIDDMDRTYVNGTLVGAYEKDGFWQTDRIYNISKEIIISDEISIAVRVVDLRGGGGIFGDQSKLKIHPVDNDESISLSGSWRYLPVAEFRDEKFFIFGSEKNDYNSKPPLKINLSANTPTSLFNGMVRPIIPYSIKGFLWYQGESNTGDPELYNVLFPLMINNWRNEWNEELPFYYVQIAPYNYGEATHSERLRESQLKTLTLPKTGMIVTLDIGNSSNIHPANKKEVGERLAFWALAKDYQKEIHYSGPLYKAMQIKDDKIIISFDYADGGLIINESNEENNFLIAGEDKKFLKAEVKLEGSNLIVFHSGIKNPKAVRYAWTNTSEATLFNGADLPASSFRTDDWDEE